MNKENNPLNIKNNPANRWAGSLGENAVGTAIFSSPSMGVRAAMRCLQKKYLAGKTTLLAIISDWAPADDTQGSLPGRPANDPADYARYVGDRIGFSIDEKLPDPSDVLAWARIVKAMSHYEMGVDCPWSEVLIGVGLWAHEFLEV